MNQHHARDSIELTDETKEETFVKMKYCTVKRLYVGHVFAFINAFYYVCYCKYSISFKRSVVHLKKVCQPNV